MILMPFLGEFCISEVYCGVLQIYVSKDFREFAVYGKEKLLTK
jgi:hypothetical protein